jgi:hypothetical protein
VGVHESRQQHVLFATDALARLEALAQFARRADREDSPAGEGHGMIGEGAVGGRHRQQPAGLDQELGRFPYGHCFLGGPRRKRKKQLRAVYRCRPRRARCVRGRRLLAGCRQGGAAGHFMVDLSFVSAPGTAQDRRKING